MSDSAQRLDRYAVAVLAACVLAWLFPVVLMIVWSSSCVGGCHLVHHDEPLELGLGAALVPVVPWLVAGHPLWRRGPHDDARTLWLLALVVHPIISFIAAVAAATCINESEVTKDWTESARVVAQTQPTRASDTRVELELVRGDGSTVLMSVSADVARALPIETTATLSMQKGRLGWTCAHDVQPSTDER